MKSLRPVLLSALLTSVGFGGPSLKGVCFDADTEHTFTVSEAIPPKVLEGGSVPYVEYEEDRKTPKSIAWEPSPQTRPISNVIGRCHGREIVDITFPAFETADGTPRPPFAAKILAYRTEAGVSAPLLPFLMIDGSNLRWYKQAFKSEAGHPFQLTISITPLGSGVFYMNADFEFAENGARILELTSGGRGMKTRIVKFRSDGTVSSSKELDEN